MPARKVSKTKNAAKKGAKKGAKKAAKKGARNATKKGAKNAAKDDLRLLIHTVSPAKAAAVTATIKQITGRKATAEPLYEIAGAKGMHSEFLARVAIDG